MTLNFNPVQFKSVFSGKKIKLGTPSTKSTTGDSDYLQNLIKQYESTYGKVSAQGLPTEVPKTAMGKVTEFGGNALTGIMKLLMSFERGISAFASNLSEGIMNTPKEQRGFTQNLKLQWDSVSEGVKSVFGKSEKYKDWNWNKFYEKLFPKMAREFSANKEYLENPIMKRVTEKPGWEWTGKKWAWLIPFVSGMKLIDLCTVLGAEMTKSPSAIAGLITGIVLDPTTYMTMGFGGGSKAASVNIGKEVAEETAESLGKGAVRKVAGELGEAGGKVFLTKAGKIARGASKQLAEGLIPQTAIGRKLIQEAEENFLIKGGKLLGQKPLTLTGAGYALGKVPGIAEKGGLPTLYKGIKGLPGFIPGEITPFATTASEKLFAKQAGMEVLEKTAWKVAEKDIARSLLTKAGKKFVDYGGIKMFGKSIIPVGFFDKVGFTKVADLLRNTRGATFLKKAFSAQGTAPPELYQSFRYNMDLLPTYQKRVIEDKLSALFKGLKQDKEARELITGYMSKPWKIQESKQFVVKRAPVKTQVIEEVTKRVKLSDIDKGRLAKINTFVNNLQLEIDSAVEKRIGKLTAAKLGVDDPIKALNNAVRRIGGIKRSKDYFSEFLEYPLLIKNKAGLEEDVMYRELNAAFPQITNVLNINNADDLSQVLRYGKRSKLSGLLRQEDIYDEAIESWIKESPENLAKYSKFEKAEEVRSILAARLSEDPLGDLTAIGGYMDLVPEKILKHFEIPKKYNTKLIKTEITREVTKYMDVISEINKRIKTPSMQLTKEQTKIANAFKGSMDTLLERERAWGKPIGEFPGYVPSYRLTGTVSKKPFAVSREIGPEIPRQQLGKVFPNPLAAKQAGIPTEMDIVAIWYRREAESINTIARTRFLRDARQWGKKVADLSPAERLSYVKGTQISASEVGDLFFKPDIANFLTKGKQFLEDEGTRNILRVYDKLTNWWKTFATAPNPGFHFRNFFSNMWQLFLKDGPRAFNPKIHSIAIDILSGTPGGNVKVLNRFYSYAELREIANANGIIGRGWLGYDVPEVIESELKFGLAGKVQQIKKGMNIASREGILAKTGTKFGRSIENEARLVGFLNDFMQSADVRFSAINTKHFMFDYGELSATEKSAKKVIPFFTWSRKNIPLQFEQLMKQPGKFAAIPKVKTYIEGLADIPEGYEENKPDYFKSLYAIATPFKDDQGNMMVFNPNFAWQDLGKINPMDWFNMLNPWLKVPLELVFNKELFYGRAVQEYKGELVPAPGYLKPLDVLPEEFLNKLGVFKGKDKILYIPAKAEYLSRQVPFLANIARAIPQKEAAATESQLRSWLTGIKLTPYEKEKSEYYKTKEKLTDIEGLIKRYKTLGIWNEPVKEKKEKKPKFDADKIRNLLESGSSLLR